jgi:CheY-like chemotaxis protein
VVTIVYAQILALLELNENSLQVVKCLKRSGHNVIAFDTFTQAIAVLQEHNEIDMIISDVHLKNGGDVFDFLRWLKSHPRVGGTPLVLFSFNPTEMAKHLEDGIRTSARILGAAKYITMEKFDSDEFLKQINSLFPTVGQIVELNEDEEEPSAPLLESP